MALYRDPTDLFERASSGGSNQGINGSIPGSGRLRRRGGACYSKDSGVLGHGGMWGWGGLCVQKGG